jgi:putative oxidoreductase
MTRDPLRYIVPIGRVLFALVFLVAAPGHFTSATIDHASDHGVPLAAVAVPLSGLLAGLGGLGVALGYRARLAAWLIIVFLVPVTFMMHDFWAVTDPAAAQLQRIMFMKNLSLLGGALLIAYYGAGPVSLDARHGRDD